MFFLVLKPHALLMTCILYKKQAHFSQLFCLQVRSVTPWESHDRKSRCLRGRRHSSILYNPSGFFSSYFINEVNFWHYKKYGSVGRFTIFGTYVFSVNIILFRCNMICRWPEPWNFKTSHFQILYSFPSRIIGPVFTSYENIWRHFTDSKSCQIIESILKFRNSF